MEGGKSVQPSRTLQSFPTDVQAACLSSEHSVPRGIVRTSGSPCYRWGQSRCLETRPLANQTEKKKHSGWKFRVLPHGWKRLEAVNCSFPVLVRPLQPVILSLLPLRHSHPQPSPALLQPGLFSSKGKVGALMWSGGPWKPLRADKGYVSGQ